jgi:hypothetical protein
VTTTPQAPDASNNPVQPPTGPQYIPQQQGAGTLPPWGPQMPQGLPPRPANNAATTGFVLALIAAVVACIPLLGTISWVLAPIGIVFAGIGLYRATPSRGGVGRTMAIWGVVLGVLALIICSVYVTAIAKAAHSPSTYSAPYTYTAPAPAYTPPSYSSGSSTGSSSASSGDSVSTPAPDPNTFTAGTYEVGTEIQPGTYRTTGSDWCYYERDKDLDGDLNSIIANDNVQGQGVMQVKSSDKYIKFSGTCTWTKK